MTTDGTYNFLVEGNIEQVGSEINIELDAYLLLGNGEQIYAQSSTTSIFDILYDAPFALGIPVETMKIHLGPVAAGILAIVSIVVIAAMFVALVFEILTTGGLLEALLTVYKKSWTILVASIGWVYQTIFWADRNPDWSLDLYIPRDEFLGDFDEVYVATAFSWWLIEEQSFLWIAYYVATWVCSRIQIPTPNLSPSASFVYSPSPIYSGQMVEFVSTSFDPDEDGEIVDHHWIFGDGTEGIGKSTTHVFQTPGTYIVQLEVTDNSGMVDESTKEITVLLPAGVPEFSLNIYLFFSIATIVYLTIRKRIQRKVE